jgi:hypothetical protein
MTARRPNSHWLVTDEPHRLGSGWLSGTIGAVLGLAALSAAGTLRWPQLLTLPELRPHLPPWLATAALLTAVLAFVLGTVSAGVAHLRNMRASRNRGAWLPWSTEGTSTLPSNVFAVEAPAGLAALVGCYAVLGRIRQRVLM